MYSTLISLAEQHVYVVFCGGLKTTNKNKNLNNIIMYRITYYREFEKFYCFVVASSEGEAIEKFHKEITDREPESISECKYGISVIRARR